MALTYQCPRCRGKLQVDPALVGKVLQCARCGQKLEAANPLQVVAGAAAPPPPEVLGRPGKRRPSEEDLDERAEKRAAAVRGKQNDFMLRYGVVLLGLLGVAALVGAVWLITDLVVANLPPEPGPR